MAKSTKKNYDSTTHEPFKRKNLNRGPAEHPDKTKKEEDNDLTRENNPDITSIPHKKSEENTIKDNKTDNSAGSISNRTEV
jgi:hypothetical protein